MGPFGLLEITMVLIIGLLIFGGDLPEVGRKLGRLWGKVQRFITLLQQDVEQETSTIQEQIELEEAEHEPYVSRQQSPETKTPEEYRSADDDPADVEDAEPYGFENEPTPEEEEEEVRTLQEEIEKRQEDESTPEDSESSEEKEEE